MLSNYIPIGNYVRCTRCGAWHDDGTFKYCLDCLDEIYEENKVKSNIDIDFYPTFDEVEGVNYKDVS